MSLIDALDAIPVFPLPNVVLFPGAPLPLHVFEPRYRVMLKDCLESHRVLVVAQLTGRIEEDGRPEIATIASAGSIVEHHALPDGRSNILVVGEARLRLDEIALEDPPRFPYRRARATLLSDLEVGVAQHDETALVAAATLFAAEVKKHDPSFAFHVPRGLSAARLADLCAYQLVIDPSVRQAMLEDLDPRSRVGRVTAQLAFQHGAMMRDAPGKVLH